MVGGLELGQDSSGPVGESEGGDAASGSAGGLEAQAEPSRVLFVKHLPPAATDEDLLAMFKVSRAVGAHAAVNECRAGLEAEPASS